LNGQTGEYSFDPSNENYQYLNAGDSLTVTIPVSVTDEHGAKATTNIIINMTGTNDTPMIASVLVVETKEDAAVIYGKLIANDIDQNAVLTYSAAAVAGFMLNGQTGEYSFDPSNENYQYLNAGDSLTVTIPVSVTDEHGAKATTNIIINMTGMNEAPTLEMSVFATTNVNELALKIFSETSEQGSVFLEFGGIPEGSKIFTPQGEDVSGGIENYSGEHLFILVFPEDVDSFGTLRVAAKDAITNTQAVEELALAYDINSAFSLIEFDQNDQSMWGSDIDATLGWHEYIPFIGEAPIKWNETTQQWDDTSEGSEWRSGIFNIIDVDLDAKSIGQAIRDWVNDVRTKADLVGKNLEAWANYTLKKIAYEAANFALDAGVTIKDGVLDAAKGVYDETLKVYNSAHNATETAKYAMDHAPWYEYIFKAADYGIKWSAEQLAYALFKTAEFAYNSALYLTKRAEEDLLEPLERAVEDTRLAMNEAWEKALVAEKAMHDAGYYTDRSVEINDSGVTVVDGAAVTGELLVAEAANLAYNTAYDSGAFDFGLDLQANAELFARVGMQVDFVLDAGSVDTNINYLLTSTSQYNETTDMLVLNPMMKNVMTGEDVAFSTISPNLQFYVALLYDVGLDFTYQLDEAYLKALGTTVFEADPIEKTTITVSTNSMASDSEMKSGELVLVDLDTRDLGSIKIPFIEKLASALKDDSAEASSLKNSLLDQLTQGMLSVEIGFPTIETKGKVAEYTEDFYKEGDIVSVDVAELTEAIFNMVNAKLDYTQEFKDLYGVGDLNPASIDDFIATFVSALGQYMIDAYGRTEGVPIFELDMKGNSTSALFHVNTFPDSYTMEGLNADSGSFGFFTAEGEGNVPLVKVSLDIDQVVAFIVNAIITEGATTTSGVPEINPLDLEIGLDYLLELAGLDQGSRNEITKYIDLGINIEAADLDAYADVNFTQQFALSVDDMEFQMILEDGTIFKFNANQEESLAIENASMYDKDGNGILDYSLQITPDANFYNDTEAKLGLGYALDLLKADFNAGVKIPLADILNMKDTKTSLPTIEISAIDYAVGPLLTIQGDLDVLSMDVFETRFDMDIGSHTYASSVDVGLGEMKSASMYVDDHGIAGV
ncbi:VCBS domain-containing protein, partial [Sulfuricurvum sp.]|uniref:VCBS domain-containing protein n=1 Tax=Sulfuricurvum sp. TaxID=2025608 RepID=UPI0026216C75